VDIAATSGIEFIGHYLTKTSLDCLEWETVA